MVAARRRQRPRPRRLDAARRAGALLAEAGREPVRQARGPEPHRLDQGPCCQGDDRGGRGVRRARAGPRAARADLRQHGHLARDGRAAQGLPADLRHARERDRGAQAPAPPLRRRDRVVAGRRRLERRGSTRARDGGERSPLVRAVPVREPGERPRTLRGNRRRDRRRRSTASTCSSPGSARAAR